MLKIGNAGESTGEKKNKAVVAVNFGGYDNLHEPEFVNPEWDYIYLTDRDYQSNIWSIKKPELLFSNNVLNSRWWMCHLDLLGYKYIVMIGGNQKFRANPEELLPCIKNGIAVYQHPQRDCLYDEAEKIKAYQIDYNDVIDYQMNRYRSEGFPENFGLTATAILVFENCPLVRNFCQLWWQEIREGSKRNQLSFDYVRWKLGVEIGYLPGQLRDDKLTSFFEHNDGCRYQGVRGLG